MNEEEFASLKVLKSKYRRGGPNNSAVLQKCLVPPKKSSPLDSSNSVILQNWFPTSSLEIGSPLEREGILENWRKVSTLNHVNYIIQRFMKNLGAKQIISDVAVTLGGDIFSSNQGTWIYSKQPAGLPKGKKQKFNQPQLGLGTYLFV